MLFAYNSLKKGVYDPKKGEFRGWLYGIAKNRARMVKRAGQKPDRQHSSTKILNRLVDRKDESLKKVWEEERKYSLINRALDHVRPELGEKVYAAFVKYVIHNRPVEEVASELGISVSSVYVYKGRVIGAVKEWLEKYDQEENKIMSSAV
jgi:RNA polymerase sigma-70 factor (ECF subfamily)